MLPAIPRIIKQNKGLEIFVWTGKDWTCGGTSGRYFTLETGGSSNGPSGKTCPHNMRVKLGMRSLNEEVSILEPLKFCNAK